MTQIAIAFQEYIQDGLGLPVQVKPWKASSDLPIFLRESFDFYQVVLMETPLLLAADRSMKEQSPASVQKKITQVRRKWDHEVVYVCSAVSSHNRKRLIQRKLAFVVPGNQMYLPLLGIDLREHFRKIREERRIVSPATQALILLLLYTHEEGPVTPTKMSVILRYSPMSMTRAFAELERIGVGEHIARGRNRELRFAAEGALLWEKVLPYMQSPVRKRCFVEGEFPRQKFVEAGLTALASYSTIAEPDIPVFAVAAGEWKAVRRKLRETPHPETGNAEIEIWSYRPDTFQEKLIADRLSVYLSLKDSKDERIEIALEEMMRGMPW